MCTMLPAGDSCKKTQKLYLQGLWFKHSCSYKPFEASLGKYVRVPERQLIIFPLWVNQISAGHSWLFNANQFNVFSYSAFHNSVTPRHWSRVCASPLLCPMFSIQKRSDYNVSMKKLKTGQEKVKENDCPLSNVLLSHHKFKKYIFSIYPKQCVPQPRTLSCLGQTPGSPSWPSPECSWKINGWMYIENNRAFECV